MKVLEENAGQRTIAVTLYNAAGAPLAGSGRTVKLALYTDSQLTEDANVTCATTQGVTVSDNTLTISGDALSRIDAGSLTVLLTYDLGSYVERLGLSEVPASGVYLYADAWAEGTTATTEVHRLSEYNNGNNQAAVRLTGAYARTGEKTAVDVVQNNGTVTTATVELRSNSLQTQSTVPLAATLLDEEDKPLETLPLSFVKDLPGETAQTATLTFSQLGSRVVVRAAKGTDSLIFEGLSVSLKNFTLDSDSGSYVHTISNVTADGVLVTAFAAGGRPVVINGETLSEGGSHWVDFTQATETITVIMSGKTYILTVERAIIPPESAQTPIITEHPADASYTVGETAKALTVEAEVSDGGTLSYQWFSNTAASNEGGTEIPGAIEPTFTPPTDTAGITYYYCVVTNTNNTATGEQTAQSTTRAAKITVIDESTIINAANPTITKHPADASYTVGDPATALTVEANVSDGGTLTYQWYSNTTDSTEDGTEISGATEPTFTPPTDTAGITYYYCVVTNTNNTATGEKEAEGVTRAAKITVEQGSTSSGSGGVTTYSITLESGENGTVHSNRKTAGRGATITLTAVPDDGYQLAGLSVEDRTGDAVALKDQKDGTYTFVMPSSAVTVKAVFIPEFADVPDDTYYTDAVVWAVAHGVTTGTGAATFSPDVSCTRAQTVTFLWRLAGSPAPAGTDNPFTDVAPGAYYYDAVLWAVEQGITKGTSETTFSPDLIVTRGQTVTFLWRIGGSPEISENRFIDVAPGAYYTDAVNWAASEGITNGTGETTFNPEAPCTRAQIVTFLYRAYA